MSFHQHALPEERMGGKVSPLLRGISCSSGLGVGVVEPSLYPSNWYPPETSHRSPVLNRVLEIAAKLIVRAHLRHLPRLAEAGLPP